MLVDKTELRDDTGNIWELGYYVTESQKEGIYGIKIERTSKNSVTETEETFGITISYEEAKEWAHMMAEGKVTPITLHDIVDDLC